MLKKNSNALVQCPTKTGIDVVLQVWYIQLFVVFHIIQLIKEI